MVAVHTATAFTVFIVERQALFAKALSALLSQDPQVRVVGAASEYDRAAIAAAAPDVVVIDVDAEGDGDALGIVQRLERDGVDTPRICVLSAHVIPAAMQRCFARGADGFIGKDTEPADLVRAVKSVAAGGSYLDPRIGAELASMRQSDHLSARETEVLRLVGACLSNKEIAVRLGLAEKTVKSHVSSILAKLHLQGRTQAAVHAMRVGLL